MLISMITLFPEMFKALDYGITGRAQEKNLLKINYYNPRDFTSDPYRRVDDRPYGGGPGMVMRVQPLRAAIQKAKQEMATVAPVIYLTPQGKKLDHDLVKELSAQPRLILLAGRYEGIDERIVEADVTMTISLGDFVISGGELAAMVLIDAMSRLIPGALGDAQSAEQDSFITGLLDCPHYTRPEIIDGMQVPEVLRSGDHQAIARWRLKQALGRTWIYRRDLLEKLHLTVEQQQLLNEFISDGVNVT